MNTCNVQYNKNKKGILRMKLRKYISSDNPDFSGFIQQLIPSEIPTQFRLTLHAEDDVNITQKSLRLFYNDYEEIRNDILTLSELLEANEYARIQSVFRELDSKINEIVLNTDLTQSVFNESDPEIKTREEVYDKNKASLLKHLKDVYGLESFALISSLKQLFHDSIISAAYYDSNTGKSTEINNETLNINILNLKNKFLLDIKQYLEYQGVAYIDTPIGIQTAFYKHLKTINDLLNKLIPLQTFLYRKNIQDEKTKKFRQIINILELEPEGTFSKRILPILKQEKKYNIDYILYLGDCYSTSFRVVKEYILKYRLELSDVNDILNKLLSEIELEEINLLHATNAYSILTHFDELLVESLGKSIDFAESTKFLDIPNKYSYHHDTSHEIKGWQTSEDIGSEKHVSKFAEAVLSLIRVFDYKNNEYRNRRVDSTSLIIAARHLIDDFLYGNAAITGSGKTVSEAALKLRKAIITFHRHPQANLHTILSLLFDTTAGRTSALVNKLTNKKLLKDYDLDILYSVYLKVFNLKDPHSFISQEQAGYASNRLGFALMQEIAAYVDSNVTLDYLESKVDYETGEIKLAVKKKFFSDLALYNLRGEINRTVNIKDLETRRKLQKEYQFKQDSNNKTLYTVENVGGLSITLAINNLSKAEILTHSDKDLIICDNNPNLFKILDEIDIDQFRQKVVSKWPLDELEIILKNILLFIDDLLDLQILTDFGLQILHAYKASYEPVDNMKSYLKPLLKLAIRAAYINNQYINARELASSLKEYLEKDSIFLEYVKNPSLKIFSMHYGEPVYVVASYADTVLQQWVDAKAMLDGQASKATTKDGQGNSIPNNSVGKLGGNLFYYLDGLKTDDKSNCKTLLFTDNPDLIKATFHDLEAVNIHLDIKSIKDFSSSELFFHAIFNKFWGSYNNSGNVVIQPTVYSDKTTFLNWEIATLLQDFDLLNDSDYENKVLTLYQESLGTFYQSTYNTSQSKLQVITDFYNLENNTNLSVIDVLRLHNEESLIALAQRLGISLTKDHDYRERKKLIKTVIKNPDGSTSEEVKTVKYCTLNEILLHNARVFNDRALLRDYLNSQKVYFLLNLIQYNSTFLVLNFRDKVSYYTLDKIDSRASSKNAIISTILNIYKKPEDRRSFFENWVDEKTGRLILAKVNGQKLIGMSRELNLINGDVELNPLLDKFFYVEGLYSNNLRLSLTGSETNHPDKAYSHVLNTLKRASDYSTFYRTIPISFELFNVVKPIIDGCNDVFDLQDQIAIQSDEVIKGILLNIYNQSVINIINTAQGTQFKRNVIIPATLQYCQLGLRNGITKTIKCAVIYDEQAPVHNFRGETDEIDSADGSAKISAFQSILENESLGSQAVGFIKKPIWHSYDVETGTSFLAKFATNTITNESMKESLYSPTSLFNLFKKMTNIQWDEPIDLIKPILLDNSLNDEDSDDMAYHDIWFAKVILQNSKLFYLNLFGDRIQILSLKRTITKDGVALYYTLEKSMYGDPVKVYHMFDEKSNHKTFGSYQQALEYYKSGQGHTINSLFELHTALGGINCVDSKGNTSEFNNQVVVNFMNNIGYKKPNAESDFVNQDNYEQPLKKYHIGYALNNTAVKNGAQNMNKSSAWYDDSELRYFEVNSDGLGMQMNADHDIIDSELTEFSQVIAATSAYGYTYDNCHEIFKGLAKTAFEASRQVLTAVDSFIELFGDNASEAQSDLYDAVGRIIFMERSIKDRESLTNVITEAVWKIFNKNKNHVNDSVKLPVSDSNIYSEFIATLASTINKASIKRKHPGSGCVMVPAYNMITYFEIGDRKESHADVLRKARENLKAELILQIQQLQEYNAEDNSYKGTKVSLLTLQQLLTITKSELLNITDILVFNRMIMDSYLDKMQAEVPILADKSYFQPEDVVNVYTPTGVLLETIVLDSMDKYYTFKDRVDLPGTTYQMNVKITRNLKPSLVRWRYNPTSSLEELQVIQSETYIKPWKSDPTKSNEAFSLSLAEDPSRSFEVVKDYEDGYWSIHFKTIPEGESFETFTPLTEELKLRLFKAASDRIPVGDKLSTWGELTPGGISGLNRFRSFGFTQIGTREVSDREGNSIQIPIYEKTGIYMNIFDHPVIKDAFLSKKGKLGAEHRKAVQNVLHNLHNGFFIMDGVRYSIIPNSLEDTEAELIMSNIYKDTFGIENESLLEILDQGEQYFINQVHRQLHAPYNKFYDIALLKDNGKHTLIKLGEVVENEYCYENPFENIAVNELDEIYCMLGNRQLFKIGKYVDLQGDELNDLYITLDNLIASRSNKPFLENQYRINGNRIQKRIDLVKRYLLISSSKNRKTGELEYTTNVLYRIIDPKQLSKVYEDYQSAYRQVGSLITKIYLQDNYKFIELNLLNSAFYQKHLNELLGLFGWFMNNNYVKEEHKMYIQEQFQCFLNNDSNKLHTLKSDYYKKEAHKKWVSFLDSLKFISSRIPAQTLQSFMTMKCVGWTSNTMNMAYVSHFQTYLQGSDYDIDKAYIMGQSYDKNGIYIQWSPLFDFTNLTTLTISKQLPSPEFFELIKVPNGINITNELETILNNTNEDLEPLSLEHRIQNLKTYVQLLRKINRAKGKINFTLTSNEKLDKLFALIYKHMSYKIPAHVAEAAYKNVASANIYAVSLDIRNRDQSYTAITMRTLLKAAEKSPKGALAAVLNMLNPLTKYVMQYQNIVGKNVISIAANGEKVWFNAYYYWTKLLKEGRTPLLQFNTLLSRVEGRRFTTLDDFTKLESRTVRHLPDLNARDEELKRNLLLAFGVDISQEEYHYVDQLISQLLSAATDNAKELILAKINSGNNFARMYIYLIMTGYNFDDIVSFMISPASEFIDSIANPNMFSEIDLHNNPSEAINLAKGLVRHKSFLHGSVSIPSQDAETGLDENTSMSKITYVRNELKRNKKYKEVVQAELTESIDEIQDLQILMLAYIKAAIKHDIDLTNIIKKKDVEIQTYMLYCLNLVDNLRTVYEQYGNYTDAEADIEEFAKIYNLATEVSSISSAWLGLNQGLPTDELGILQRFKSMRKTITTREKALGMFPSLMFTDSKDPKKIQQALKYFNQVVDNIINNNNSLSVELVYEFLNWAKEKDLIGTFDVYRYLTDEEYKKDMIKYNHYIKGTLNVLHMMDEIEHYKEIMHCFKALVVSKQTLSSKSRILNKLIQDSDDDFLDQKQIRGIIRYVDNLNAYNFAKSFGKMLTLPHSIEGFNSYFELIKTDTIDLSTFSGIATFKHWIEHEFLAYLKEHHRDNPLVNHLRLVSENLRSIIATDIDLMHPNTTLVTRLYYDEILRGMAMFELILLFDTSYTIADIFQMYNILVNKNLYGKERLTTTFKACSNPKSILNLFFAFLAELDFDVNTLIEYNLEDYYINAAPIVSTSAEKYRTDKFIKVNDPIRGYVLKRYIPKSNVYIEYNLIPPKENNRDKEHTLLRMKNFAEYCPFEMPAMANIMEMYESLEYVGDVTDEVMHRIKNVLIDLVNSGQVIIFKDC